MPKAKGGVFTGIPEALRGKTRGLSQEHSLACGEPLWEAPELITQGNTLGMTRQEQPEAPELITQGNTLGMTRQEQPEAPELITQGNTLGISRQEQPEAKVEVIRRDCMRRTTRAGEGWNAVETGLNNMQLRKLCQAKLLATRGDTAKSEAARRAAGLHILFKLQTRAETEPRKLRVTG